jgi:hypothetical protein
MSGRVDIIVVDVQEVDRPILGPPLSGPCTTESEVGVITADRSPSVRAMGLLSAPCPAVLQRRRAWVVRLLNIARV